MQTHIIHAEVLSTEQADTFIRTADELVLNWDAEYVEGFEGEILQTLYVYSPGKTYIYDNISAHDEAQEARGLGQALGEAMGYWNE